MTVEDDLNAFLRALPVSGALAGFSHPGADLPSQWDVRRSPQVVADLLGSLDPALGHRVATLSIASLGAATVMPFRRDSLRSAASPCATRETSELVPPMSKPTARSIPWRDATAHTARAPPAGPE
jgi:hypothetical protein